MRLTSLALDQCYHVESTSHIFQVYKDSTFHIQQLLINDVQGRGFLDRAVSPGNVLCKMPDIGCQFYEWRLIISKCRYERVP